MKKYEVRILDVYPMVWLVMIGIGVAMLMYFRKKRWGCSDIFTPHNTFKKREA
jgi:hypothetical protein